MKWLLNWGWILLYACLLAIAVFWIAVQNEEPMEEAQIDKITLTFRHFWNREHDKPVLDIVESIVKTFQETHPNVKVNFEGMDQTVHREQKLKSEMVTGTPPDMFVLFGGAEIEPYVRSNRLMDLTEFVETRQLESQFQDLQLWTFNDRVFGLPMEGNAEPLYYNRTLFEKLGIAPPTTLNELDEAIRILKGHDIIPFALGNEDRWPAGIFAHYLMDRYAGPELILELIQGKEGLSFNNELYLKAFQHMETWIKEEAFSPLSNDLSTEEAITLFTQGKAAMYLNGNWDINLFHNEDKAGDFQNEVGVIPFPAMSAGDTRSMAGGYTIGIGLSSNLDDAKKEAAYELLESLYTKEVQTRLVYEGLRIPSMKIQYDPEMTGPVFAQVIGLMEQSTASFVPYDNILSPEVKKSFLEVIEDMVGARTGAVGALKEIERSSVQYWQLRESSLAD